MKRCAFLLALLACPPALAQQQAYTRISSGTGFIINRSGDIVTNAHVLQNCQSISVLNEQGEAPAQLIARDDARDLAVIRAPLTGSQMVAPLRWNISGLRPGDEVAVFGYPGTAGANGQSRYARTMVVALEGSRGETTRLQLKHVIEQGNSGGAVIDGNGHVIGVVVAIAQLLKADAYGRPTGEVAQQSDLVITLAELQGFLDANRIGFYQSTTGNVGYADQILMQNAYKFIVPIRCNQGLYTG